MRSWLSKNRHVYWLLGLIALALAYFVTQHLGLQYHVVHLPLDDRIPFCPAFVVFYILWYFYVPGCMLWACLRAKDVFCRQAAAVFVLPDVHRLSPRGGWDGGISGALPAHLCA